MPKAAKTLPVLYRAVIAARAAGYPVKTGKAGGGWLYVAAACGKECADKAEARKFLREKFGNSYSTPGQVAVSKTKEKERREEVFERRINSKRAVISAATAPSFITSFEWRRLRTQVLRHYGPKCMCCGATPADGAVMNVDHILPRKTHPHLALDFDNLQVLCNPCNHGKGNWDRTDWRPKSEAIDPEVSSMLRQIARYG